MEVENKMEKREKELLNSLEQAKETENYGAYISIGNEMIGYYMEKALFQKAFDRAEDVLLLMEELNMEQSEHFAETLLNAAQVYKAVKNTEQAYRYYLQALSIYEKLLPAEDYRFAGLYRDLSFLLEQMGKKEEAAIYYGAALTGMGEACYLEGNYKSAFSYYEKAAETIKEYFGENDAYASLCANCKAVRELIEKI